MEKFLDFSAIGFTFVSAIFWFLSAWYSHSEPAPKSGDQIKFNDGLIYAKYRNNCNFLGALSTGIAACLFGFSKYFGVV